MPDCLRHVVAISGLPGAGKSVVARFLADELGLCVVDRDRIRAAMFPECRFTAGEKHAANRAVLEAVRANCALDLPSIVDGQALSRQVDRDSLRRTAEDCGFRFVLVFLDCPVEIAAARIAADRGHPAGDRGPDLVRDVASRFDRPPDDAITIDGTGPPEQVCAETLRALRERPAASRARPARDSP